jgi:ribose transport system permease protein
MLLLYRSRFGQSVYAIGGSEDAARLMGVKLHSTKVRVYVLSGLLAGLAGAINAARLGSGVTVLGTGMELDAIAAVVIGGTSLSGGRGTMLGTMIGALIISVVANGLRILSVPQEWQIVVTGSIIIIAVYTDILRRRGAA